MSLSFLFCYFFGSRPPFFPFWWSIQYKSTEVFILIICYDCDIYISKDSRNVYNIRSDGKKSISGRSCLSFICLFCYRQVGNKMHTFNLCETSKIIGKMGFNHFSTASKMKQKREKKGNTILFLFFCKRSQQKVFLCFL